MKAWAGSKAVCLCGVCVAASFAGHLVLQCQPGKSAFVGAQHMCTLTQLCALKVGAVRAGGAPLNGCLQWPQGALGSGCTGRCKVAARPRRALLPVRAEPQRRLPRPGVGAAHLLMRKKASADLLLQDVRHLPVLVFTRRWPACCARLLARASHRCKRPGTPRLSEQRWRASCLL